MVQPVIDTPIAKKNDLKSHFTTKKFTPICKTPDIKLSPKTQRICRRNNLVLYYPFQEDNRKQAYFTTTSNSYHLICIIW